MFLLNKSSSRSVNHLCHIFRQTGSGLEAPRESKNMIVLLALEGSHPWYQQLRFGVFREGVFQKMPALEGQFLKEIFVRFAGEIHLRTQKNTKQSSAQRFLNDPFPKTPFFSCWDKIIRL